jgi:PIN like domain
LKFIFDENHPPVLARVLAPLVEVDGHTAASVRHLGLAGTKDVDLLHTLADPTIKVVLITADIAMSRRRHEVAAIRETGAVVVVGMKGWNQQKDTMERVRMMVWWWPTIVRSCWKLKPVWPAIERSGVPRCWIFGRTPSSVLYPA